MQIVIDTNIFISALIKNGLTRAILIKLPFLFILPEVELLEIKEYEKEILRKSHLNSSELNFLIRTLLKRMKIISSNKLMNYRKKAEKIMGQIDKKDVVFIATALYTNSPIWSDDKHFQKQKEIRIFTTEEIFNLIKQL